MIALPGALRPWREPLALLHELVPAGIGPWLSPLRTLFGPMRIPRRARLGDPDGVDGLARRGDYDRLLLSEWAIALDLPDEFLRRAAMGEHVFLAPAFREPHGAHTSVALLDCGPSQLGAPRLAQLAALVVLQQRAVEHGAEFRFGSLQDGAADLHVFDRSGIASWLAARTWAPPLSDTPGWRMRLDEVDAQDTWVLGGPDSADVATRLQASWIGITPPASAAHRRLVLRARRFGTTGDRVELALPDDDTCVRILRMPLGTMPRPSFPVDASSRVPGTLGQLTLDGRRLLLPQGDGAIHAHHVANTMREPVGRTKKLLPIRGSRVIGADLIDRRLVAIAVTDDRKLVLRGSGLHAAGVWGAPRTASTVVDSGISLPESFALDDAPVTTFVSVADRAKFRAWLLDHRVQLWALEVDLDGSLCIARASLDIVDRSCSQLTRIARDVVAWTSGSLGRVMAIQATEDPPPLDLAALPTVVFSAYQRRPALPAFAWRDSDGAYRFHGFAGVSLPPLRPSEGRVFGAGGFGPPPHLLVLSAARDTISRVSASGTETLYRSTQPIAQIVHHPSCQRIVARTELDEVIVIDVSRAQLVLRIAAPTRQEAYA